MQVRAKVRNLRMSPKKIRLVVDVIRGLDVDEAYSQLAFITKKAVRPVKKLLDSAIANATNNFGLRQDNLYIKEIMVDGGPVLKRWRPRAFGRASKIVKRTSHIFIVLSERVPSSQEKLNLLKAKAQQTNAKVQEKKESESVQETMPTEDLKSEDLKPKKDIIKTPSVSTNNKQQTHAGKIFDAAKKREYRHMQHQDKKGS